MFYLLRSRIKNDKIQLAVSFAIGILSVIAGLNKLPYCIDRTLIALPFFAVGHSLKTILLNLGEIKKEKLFALAIVCFAVLYFLQAGKRWLFSEIYRRIHGNLYDPLRI